jgi:hypothetical protein
MFTSTATLTALSLLLFLAKVFVTHLHRPKLPSPDQGPFWKRLLTEPTSDQLVEWALTIPHNGPIRYRGAMNREKVLVCSVEGAKAVSETHADAFSIDPGLAKALKDVLGDGLVMTEPHEHRVNVPFRLEDNRHAEEE